VSTTMDVELRPDPGAISVARKAIERAAADAPGPLLDNARLLVSELITNSVRHAGLGENARIGLHVDIGPDVLRVEVTDPGPGFEPEERVLTIYQQSGWGLFLVDQIADRWGVDRDQGTRVWFEIDRSA
jgi:anti-sigma regulatory factor (Ser/Thr protein kinase)